MPKNVVRVYVSHVMILAGHTAVMHNSYVAHRMSIQLQEGVSILGLLE